VVESSDDEPGTGLFSLGHHNLTSYETFTSRELEDFTICLIQGVSDTTTTLSNVDTHHREMDLRTEHRPKIVGLYGLPGSGKSTLLRLLADMPEHHEWLFFEGSKKIAEHCPGGLSSFENLSVAGKATCREKAIQSIERESIEKGRSAVVAGHFMFWNHESECDREEVWTSIDARTFTHIIYLDTPVADIERQRSEDTQRSDRGTMPAARLEAWKAAEKQRLHTVCYEHEILLSLVETTRSSFPATVSKLLRNFEEHNEAYNHTSLMKTLDELIVTHYDKAETLLLVDADKTLAPLDSGHLFWNRSRDDEDPLEHLFCSLGYSYHSFRQAMLLYKGLEETTFNRRCAEVAEKIEIHSEFLQLLHLGARDQTLGIMVVTCGLKDVWSAVLQRDGLCGTIPVIGSGRLDDQVVVTPTEKRELVARLQKKGFHVWAFGDSPLDLPMLQQADEAIVVVAEDLIRSSSMDRVLRDAIIQHGLRARQILLPREQGITPRLSVDELPVVDFDGLVAKEIHQTIRGHLELVQATDTTMSRLLATDMRDARISGHALRKVHIQAGWLLAIEYVSQIIGLETVILPHVSGGETTGYRLKHEKRTSIVACMRGGEAMALGVSKAFPLARFFHISEDTELESHHLHGQSCVIVVDSVINEGTTIVGFVKRIRALNRSIRIVVVAGVAQAASVANDGPIAQCLDRRGNLTIAVLRVSQNKYTGSGSTDTGNRLFNTVYQEKEGRLMLLRSIS